MAPTGDDYPPTSPSQVTARPNLRRHPIAMGGGHAELHRFGEIFVFHAAKKYFSVM
jgi:hypothetical protein